MANTSIPCYSATLTQIDNKCDYELVETQKVCTNKTFGCPVTKPFRVRDESNIFRAKCVDACPEGKKFVRDKDLLECVAADSNAEGFVYVVVGVSFVPVA